MQRLLLIILALVVVWRILAMIGRRLSEKSPGADSFSRFSPEARRRRRQSSQNQTGTMEELVECVTCGTFVPVGRALSDGSSRVFCSEDCRRRATAPTELERNGSA
jgi:hypothetical protein